MDCSTVSWRNLIVSLFVSSDSFEVKLIISGVLSSFIARNFHDNYGYTNTTGGNLEVFLNEEEIA